MVQRRLVLVTRPGASGRRLSAQLRAGGESARIDALWWPAFELRPAAEREVLRRRLQGLDRYDLVVLVSPGAVEALAGLFEGRWPTATRLAAVGQATLQSACATLPGAAEAPRVAPAAAESGSEGLWEALALGPPPRRVLIVRAESGREWLADRLREAGAEVESLAAYQRLEHAPSALQWAALRSAVAAGTAPVLAVSSSEAVEVLERQFADLPGLPALLRQQAALAVHPRVAAALVAAGFGRVAVVAMQCEAMLAALGGSAPLSWVGAAEPYNGGHTR